MCRCRGEQFSTRTLDSHACALTLAQSHALYIVGDEAFSSPAPPGPYPTNLAVFRDTNPNGVWSLFVMDRQSVHGASSITGWALALETMRTVDTVLFDKTGTLTTGQHVVRDFAAARMSPDEMLRTAAAVEALSGLRISMD